MNDKRLLRDNLKLKIELEKVGDLLSLYRHDDLTGMKLRRDFQIRFDEFFKSGIKFYLTLIDINRLHTLNREQGFDAGDLLIKGVAEKIIGFCTGMSYRIGGDEFTSISFDEPAEIEDQDFVYVWVSSADFKSSKEMFNRVDEILIEKKKSLYTQTDNDRRN